MKYIHLYIKRTFTNNLKKQVFLVLGIAAFVAMLASEVMRADADEWGIIKDLKRYNIGFSAKIPMIPLDGVKFLEEHAEITHVETLEVVNVIDGPVGIEFITSSNVLGTWRLDYLYGEAPGPGEIVLTDEAAIGKRQPELGEVLQLSLKIGKEEKQIDAVVSGVIRGAEDYTGGYAFLYTEDFTQLTEGIPKEERCYDAFVQNIYGDYLQGTAWHMMYEKFGVDFLSISPEMICVEYDVQTVVFRALRVVVLFGACLAAIICMILSDDRKTIGVFRTLGASKAQITTMVTVRVLVSGLIGTVIGVLLVVFVECTENLLTVTDSGSIDNIGWPSLLIVPLGVFVALLVLQIPALHYLLRETPVDLMKEVVKTGENLVRLKNRKVIRVKNPIWWYAGLECKRAKERQRGLVIISVVALFLASETCLQLQARIQESGMDATEITYSIRKAEGNFQKEELTKLSGLHGLHVEMPTEDVTEPFREVAVELMNDYETMARTVKETVPGVRLVEDKRYVGNTEEELNRDTAVSVVVDVIIALLTAVMFLLCYYSFYYLEKIEEYRRLYAIGASQTMIRKVMLFHSLRSSFVIALINGALSYGVYRFEVEQYTGNWLKEDITLLPVMELLTFFVLVIGVSMWATWFASKQVIGVLIPNIAEKTRE